MQPQLLFYFILLSTIFLEVVAVETTSNEINIQWLTDDKSDLPYLFGNKQHSLTVDTNNQVLRNLKAVKFAVKVAQIPRINQLLKTDMPVCVGNRIKTVEREKHNIFSLPIHIYPGLRLYFISENTQLPKSVVNKNGELISLSSLFSALPDSKIGVVQQRSYGNYLDRALVKQKHKNLVIRSGGAQYSAMISMLFSGRIDFILEFPTTVFEKLNISGINKTISSVAIKGNPNHILSYFACSKTEAGFEFIKRVNDIVIQQYKKNAFYQAHARYISYFDLTTFDKTYRTVFNTEPPK